MPTSLSLLSSVTEVWGQSVTGRIWGGGLGAKAGSVAYGNGCDQQTCSVGLRGQVSQVIVSSLIGQCNHKCSTSVEAVE